MSRGQFSNCTLSSGSSEPRYEPIRAILDLADSDTTAGLCSAVVSRLEDRYRNCPAASTRPAAHFWAARSSDGEIVWPP